MATSHLSRTYPLNLLTLPSTLPNSYPAPVCRLPTLVPAEHIPALLFLCQFLNATEPSPPTKCLVLTTGMRRPGRS
eukprot:3907473-Rhodomonas_salina.4